MAGPTNTPKIAKTKKVPEIEQYDYPLPRELIAQQPLPRRSDARLMVVDRRRASIDHHHVRELPQLLTAGDCLVANDTRVLPARLVGYRAKTGGRWFGLFLEADDQGIWKLLCKTRGRLAAGDAIVLQDPDGRDSERLILLAKLDGGIWAARPEIPEDALTLLARVGRVPLPHYIRGGEMVDADRKDYQTVFADQAGAVAAPTAGLHFTSELLDELNRKRIGLARLTLHVGTGTFRPITADSLNEHQMHREWGSLSAQAAEQLNECRDAGGRIVAIGTTSVRVLETAAQDDGTLAAWQGETELFIHPPYSFRGVDALLTNFHLPRTSLLVLVRSFGGDELIRRAYEEAVQEQYRFFSYGDAMLIL